MHTLRRFHDLYRGEAELDWPADLRCLIPGLSFIILTGPLIFLVYACQDWCAASAWDGEDRWQGTRAFAIAFLLSYVPLLLFRADLAHLWPPFLGRPVWYNPLVWWCWCAPLAPALALLSERLDPRTKSLERILLPSDLPHPQPTPPQKKPSSARTTRRKPTTARPSERRTGTRQTRQPTKEKGSGSAGQTRTPPQLVLPQSPLEGAASSSPTSSAGSTRQAKKSERDEGESLQDIF